MHRRAFLLAALLLAACSQTPTTPISQPEGNAAPTVTLTASQLEGEAEFSVNFVVEATDPDADTLTYRYTVNGEAIEHSESTLALTFYKAGGYRVEVLVSDGKHTVSDRVSVTALDELRPLDAPDVVILGFAGRCGIGFLDCSAPTDNYSYLDRDAKTLQTLEATFQSLGYTTEKFSFRAHLLDDASRGLGYQAAEYALEAIRDLWIRDYENPTRVVLVAHSHGNQFMSLLAMNHPEVTFDYAVYLDAVCFRWDADHVKSGRFGSVYGSQANWPKPLNTLGAACDTVKLPGISDYQDISDVVPENVTYALEVRSNGISGIPAMYDDEKNHRFDGSRRYIESIYKNEGHMRVDDSDSAAIGWVTSTIANVGLPRYGLTSQATMPLEVAPAPEGFTLDR